MPEPKPGEQYEVTPILPGGNGDNPTPTIDDESKHIAMAQAAIENQLRQREEMCNREIGETIQAIGKKYRCEIRIMATHDVAADKIVNVYIQAIALERTPRQQAQG